MWHKKKSPLRSHLGCVSWVWLVKADLFRHFRDFFRHILPSMAGSLTISSQNGLRAPWAAGDLHREAGLSLHQGPPNTPRVPLAQDLPQSKVVSHPSSPFIKVHTGSRGNTHNWTIHGWKYSFYLSSILFILLCGGSFSHCFLCFRFLGVS